MTYQLAHFNFAMAHAPLDDPRMAGNEAFPAPEVQGDRSDDKNVA